MKQVLNGVPEAFVTPGSADSKRLIAIHPSFVGVVVVVADEGIENWQIKWANGYDTPAYMGRDEFFKNIPTDVKIYEL